MTVVVKTTDGEENQHFSADSVKIPTEEVVPVTDGTIEKVVVMNGEEEVRTYLADKVVWFEE